MYKQPTKEPCISVRRYIIIAKNKSQPEPLTSSNSFQIPLNCAVCNPAFVAAAVARARVKPRWLSDTPHNHTSCLFHHQCKSAPTLLLTNTQFKGTSRGAEHWKRRRNQCFNNIRRRSLSVGLFWGRQRAWTCQNRSTLTVSGTCERPGQQRQFVTKLKCRSSRGVKLDVTFFIYL